MTQLQARYLVFDSSIQYKPTNINGGLYTVYTQVLYNDVVYQYVDWGTEETPSTTPKTYMTPDQDESAEPLYQLSATASHILITEYTLASVINGNLSLAGRGVVSKSDDITINNSLVAIFLPNNKTYANGQIKLNVTSGAGAGAKITVRGNDCTVVSEIITIGASETNKNYTINFTVKTSNLNSSNIQLIGSDVVGSVSINNTSSIHLS
jgi:hypothetical protein